MNDQLFHVFRNTPFGKDTLLQSIFFAKHLNLDLKIYIPKDPQFVMYFPQRAVTVELNKYFLYDPKTAWKHADRLVKENGVEASFFEPKDFTAMSLPDVPVNVQYMCCPRSIVDLSTKIGMGYIGPKVRQIIHYSTFPVLIPTPVYKEWKRIIVFFGGSANAIRAMEVALKLKTISGLPLIVFTKAERKPKTYYEEILEKHNLLDPVHEADTEWMFFDKGSFRKLLYEVPSDALVVAGSYGHGVVKELVFGSKIEEIQKVVPNNMLIIGPHC